MKFIHLSDLHLGKRVNEYSMLEDQAYILTEILRIIDEEAPDAVILAGDIYDKSVPSAEAVQLFDDFLCSLAGRKKQIFIISGNHDSPERIAFASRLLGVSGVHLSPVYDGSVRPVTLEDAFGPVDFYMLPFLKPVHVRRFYGDEPTATYSEALGTAIGKLDRDPERRSVLITHQFVTGAARSESEDLSVGGADNVDAAVFEGFDYVALGHLHGPQNVETERIRYCGSPLKYSFSEASQEKSATVVTLAEKGSLRVKTVPLTPKRDLRELRGTYMELTAKASYAGTNTDDYVCITLTDEEDIPDAIGKLRVIYPNLMKLDYDNRRTRAGFQITGAADVEQKSPLELFGDFYELQNGQPMSEEQKAFSAALMEEILEGRR